jgi:hypothetical protein
LLTLRNAPLVGRDGAEYRIIRIFGKAESFCDEALTAGGGQSRANKGDLPVGMVFNAGEWRAKLGDGQQLRGYYSALLVREGDGVKIFEETVNVAVP